MYGAIAQVLMENESEKEKRGRLHIMLSGCSNKLFSLAVTNNIRQRSRYVNT